MTPAERQLIDEQFKTLRAEWRADIESIMTELGHIKEQTKRTNGRVTKLEQETNVGRWFERKPQRFGLLVMFLIVLYHDSVREMLLNLI